MDVGTRQSVPVQFMDLLTVTLSQKREVALLERHEISRLLREQALGLAMSGQIDSVEVVKAGKLWTVDAFLMLEANTNQTLRVRLVDTRYGLKVWDSFFAIGNDAKEFEARAQVLVKGAIYRLANLTCGTDTPRTVSLSAFRNEEISKRYDWLGDEIAAGVEQQLALQPGIIVMERARIRPLREERTLVADLPESLRASSVIVDGVYRIVREKGPDAVSLAVRCRRNNLTTLETTVQGSLTNLVAVYRAAAKTISSSLGTSADCAPMDTSAEADMLGDEAVAQLHVQHDPSHCLALAEAASALQPDNTRYDLLALRAIMTLILDAHDKQALFRSIELAHRGNDLAARIIVNQPANQEYEGGHGSEAEYWINGYWQNFLNAFGPHPSKSAVRHPDAEIQTSVADLHQSFWKSFRLTGEVLKAKNSPGLHHYLYLASGTPEICWSVEDAIAMRQWVLLESVRLCRREPPHRLPTGSVPRSVFCCGLYTRWPCDKHAAEVYQAFLKEMTEHPDALVRAAGELSMARSYLVDSSRCDGPAKDVTEVRKHFLKLAAIFRDELIPQFSYPNRCDNGIAEFALDALKLRVADDPSEDLAAKRQYLGEMSDCILESRNEAVVASYRDIIMHYASYLEQAGQIQQAESLLERVAALESSPCGLFDRSTDALKELRARHPEVYHPGAAESVHTYTRVRCFGFDALGSSNRTSSSSGRMFTRLVRDDDRFLLVYDDGSDLGVIELDDKFHVLRELRSSKPSLPPADVGYWKSRYLRTSVLRCDDDIVVGAPGAGIIIFRPEDKTEWLTDTNMLPGNNVEALARLSGKLYAVIGRGDNESGLVEIDLQRGIANTLFSSRSKQPRHELDGRPIRDMLADERNGRLWLLMGHTMKTLSEERWPPGIYAYHPSTGRFSRIRESVLDRSLLGTWDNEGSHWEYSEHSILTINGGFCLHSDREFQSFKLLWAQSRHRPALPRWAQRLNRWDFWRFACVGEHLICYGNRDMLLFRHGQDKPESLKDRLLPEFRSNSDRIRDLVSTVDGLLILTDHEIWLVPELAPEQQHRSVVK